MVNITAGPGMSIGEFEEVGDVVKEFVSDDATVVVGTVIDPEMTEEMRVTVIVTGLGGETRKRAVAALNGNARIMESRKVDGSLDYQQLDRPAVSRKQTSTPIAAKINNTADVDYLDIPAFLRRQEEA